MNTLLKPLLLTAVVILGMAGLAQAQHSLPPVNPLPPYTKGDLQIVTWPPGSWRDSSGVSAFLLQWSLSESFSPLYDAASNVSLNDTVLTVPDDPLGLPLPEDTVWYRVVAVLGTNVRVYSDSLFSIQDATPPEVDLIQLLAGGQPIGSITNVPDLTADFRLIEPAGLDTVALYIRHGGESGWNRIQTWTTPATDNFEFDLSSLIADDGDRVYEIAVGAIDQARPPGWPDSTGLGNELTPTTALLSAGVDTHDPAARFVTDSLDSLYAVDAVELFWVASDDSLQPYYSGLDEVRLLWTANQCDNGMEIESGAVSLATGSGEAILTGSHEFSLDHDNACYILRIEATDVAGNVFESPPYDSIRVQKVMEPELQVFDQLDTTDHDFSGDLECGVTVSVLGVDHAHRVRLCESLDPNSINSCNSITEPGLPLRTTYTFTDDSTRTLYVQIDVGDTLLIDSAHITVDVTRPVLTGIVLPRTTGKGGTVQVQLTGFDAPLDSIQKAILWEAGHSSTPQVIPVDSFGQIVTFTLTEGYEKKIIHARVEDRAENRSADEVTAEYLRIAEPHSYPNPFNPDEGEVAHIMCAPGSESEIAVFIYDLLGNLVLESRVPALQSGSEVKSILDWDGRNGRGEEVASGGYVCVLEQDGELLGKIKIAVVR